MAVDDYTGGEYLCFETSGSFTTGLGASEAVKLGHGAFNEGPDVINSLLFIALAAQTYTVGQGRVVQTSSGYFIFVSGDGVFRRRNADISNASVN